METVRLWRINEDKNGKRNISEIQEIKNIETEKKLEDILVQKPDLLISGLKIVSRQAPSDGGYLDLLGIDDNGSLVVFELKRGNLTRDAVSQIIDYGSFLASMNKEELYSHIEERSGQGGIENISDFESWYAELYSGDQEQLEGNIKMVLVGLGVDEKALRMTQFLSDHGVDISLITFNSFIEDGQTFLARKTEIEPKQTIVNNRYEYNKVANKENLIELTKKIGVEKLFEDYRNIIADVMRSAYEWPGKTCVTFSLTEKADSGRPSLRAYISIYLNENKKGSIEIVIQKRAKILVKDLIDEIKKKYSFISLDQNDNIKIDIKQKDDTSELRTYIAKLAKHIESEWQEHVVPER